MHSPFASFVLEHGNDDTADLLLHADRSGDGMDRFSGGVDLGLACRTIESRRKLRGKLPSWVAQPELWLPSPLSAEQCSSELTARFKALIVAALGVRSVCDITGGLGADDVAFISGPGDENAAFMSGHGTEDAAVTGVVERLHYNDMNPALVEAAKHNFPLLGVDKATFSCVEVRPETDIAAEICGAKEVDMIFADPARRSGSGGKVFLLEDCSPDILELDLLSKARFVMLKLSPMADCTMLLGRLGGHCRDLYIIESGRECKEILILMDREHEGGCACHAVVLKEGCEPGVFDYSPKEESEAQAVYDTALGKIGPQELWLFEPGKALMKAGVFKSLCTRHGLMKLAPSTHLYTCKTPSKHLEAFGKHFKILETRLFCGRNIKSLAASYPAAEVSARNLKITSDELRKRLAVSPGGHIHIFACPLADGTKVLICCEV